MALRGQGSSEYLILLAVVLVVTLVAVVLVGGFPSFGGDAAVTEAQQYWQTSARPFAITEYSQVGDVLFINLLNTETSRLVIKNITVNDAGREHSITTIPADGVTYGGGARKTLNISNVTMCDPVTFDQYEYYIVIDFDTSAISGQKQTGTKPILGKCVY